MARDCERSDMSLSATEIEICQNQVRSHKDDRAHKKNNDMLCIHDHQRLDLCKKEEPVNNNKA